LLVLAAIIVLFWGVVAFNRDRLLGLMDVWGPMLLYLHVNNDMTWSRLEVVTQFEQEFFFANQLYV
jgi:hypothetical protein